MIVSTKVTRKNSFWTVVVELGGAVQGRAIMIDGLFLDICSWTSMYVHTYIRIHVAGWRSTFPPL
jgi:hypothetical protein